MITFWNDRLSVGDPLIDSEHRQVMKQLNEIGVALGIGVPPLVIEKALESLVRGIDGHFARGGVASLPGEHAVIMARAHHLLDDWRDGRGESVDRRALRSLAERWIAHFGRTERPRPAEGQTAAATASSTAISAACCTAPSTSPV